MIAPQYQYLSGITYYDTHAEAKAAFSGLEDVLELHADGTAAIVRLQFEPVQPGQVPYVMNKRKRQ